MRIVAGKLRGRRLQAPRDQSIRPTTDRNRESLFNVLSHHWPQHLRGKVLDVFAGTGALGLEALSRGASCCVFMEKNRQGLALIEDHVAAFGLTDQARIVRADATRPGSADPWAPFDLIFADPPYGRGLGEKAIRALADQGWIADQAIVVLEEKRGHLPEILPGFDMLDQRDSGDTSIGMYKYVTG